MLPDHHLKELYKPNGGTWGGTMVDEAYFKFLSTLTGTMQTCVLFIVTNLYGSKFLFRYFARDIQPDVKYFHPLETHKRCL